MKNFNDSRILSKQRNDLSIIKIVKKSEDFNINQSNLLQKIQKYKCEQKNIIESFEDFLFDKSARRENKISDYKIVPKSNKHKEFDKQQLVHLRQNYYRVTKRQFSFTADIVTPQKMFETFNNNLPSIEALVKSSILKRQTLQLAKTSESGLWIKSSHRPLSGRIRNNTKDIITKIQTNRLSKPSSRSNSVKLLKKKKEKKQSLLRFADLVDLQTFSQYSLSEYFRNDPEIKKIKAKSISILSNNTFLFNFDSSVSREIASLTKIMTTYIAILLIKIYKINTKTTVKVSRTASELGGTTAQLKAGDMITYDDLLYGVMLPSGNDAAFTIAEQIGKIVYMKSSQYHKIKQQAKRKLQPKIILSDQDCEKRFSPSTFKSIDVFVGKMNQFAKYLGLKNTSFSNSHGLSDVNNKSTSYDVAILCHYAMKQIKFRTIVNTRNHICKVSSLQTKLQREIQWQNTNKMLQSHECIGIKTGVTNPAGPCMASCFKRNNKQYIITILKTTNLNSRFIQARSLFQIAYKHIRRQQLKQLQIQKQVYNEEYLKKSSSTTSELC